MAKRVNAAFELNGKMIPLTSIRPLRQFKPGLQYSQKFQQILSSVKELGIIEPLVVYPQRGEPNIYLLTDGHIRLEVLKQLGKTEAPCLISTDDEAYTYNKKISRLATVQEHSMILKAIKNGVAEERIAKTLNVDVRSIAERRDLLNGICPEAADLLKNSRVAPQVFPVLRKMKSMRQIEVAELMTAAASYSVPYAKALLAATPSAMLVDPDKHKVSEGLSPEQISKMENEMTALQRDVKLIEYTHGNAVLNLVLARGYLSKLFENSKVSKYLAQNHGEILQELKNIAEGASLNGK